MKQETFWAVVEEDLIPNPFLCLAAEFGTIVTELEYSYNVDYGTFLQNTLTFVGFLPDSILCPIAYATKVLLAILAATVELAGGLSAPPSGSVTAPANPSNEFHVSAVSLFLVPNARIWDFASKHSALAASLASQTLVSWSQMRFVMMSVKEC